MELEQEQTSVRHTFERCIHPVSVETFFEEYWEKKPLLIQRSQPDYYDGLLSVKDLDDVLSSHIVQNPNFRLAKNGRPLPARTFIQEGFSITNREVTGMLDMQKVYAQFNDGASIIMQVAHRNWPAINQLCREWEHAISCTTQATALLSPPNASGLSTHYDTQENFILQLEGSKRWRLHGTPFPHPLPHQTFDRENMDAGECEMDFVLEQGDFLYTPRGLVHDPRTTDEYSLHVTVSVVPFLWMDAINRVVQKALKACEDDPELRTGFPVGFANSAEGLEKTRAILGEKMDAFQEHLASIDLDEIVDDFAERFVKRPNPYRPGQLLESLNVHTITADTRVYRRYGVFFKLERANIGMPSVRLRVDGNKVNFPIFFKDAVEFVTENTSFLVNEIPGNLSEAEQVTLVRNLVKEGFLTTREEYSQ